MISSDRIFLGKTNSSSVLIKILYSISAIFVALLAIPLFFNFSNFKFFLRNVRIEGYLLDNMGGIPFPFFGFLLLVSFIIICFVKYRTIIKSFKRIDVFILVSSTIFLITMFLSKTAILAVVQILLFPLLLWLLSFFNIEKKISQYYILGATFWAIAHFCSIFYLNNYSLIAPFDRSTVYETIFNYQIYQGLISYVNVLTVLSVAILYFLIKEKKITRLVFLSLSSVVVLYVSALSSQRQYAVDLILISFFFLIICLFNKKIQRRNKIIVIFVISFVWCLSIFFVHSGGTTAPKRLLNTVLGVNKMLAEAAPVDNIQSYGLERVDHIDNTLYSISDRVKVDKIKAIISGTGRVQSGAHNFILDLIDGFGFLGAFAYIFLLFSAFFRFIKPCVNVKLNLLVIILLLALAIVGSMFNSPLTQPYYFLNFLFVAWLVASDTNSKEF